MIKATVNRTIVRFILLGLGALAGLSITPMMPAFASPMTVRSIQALEMTGLGVGTHGGRIVTAARNLEMTSLGVIEGGGRTVTAVQALEMTGLGVDTVSGRIVTSAQALEMTGL